MPSNPRRLIVVLLLLSALAWGFFFYTLANAAGVVAPTLWKSSDTGAETLSGTTGELLRLLDTTLIINRAFSAISGGTFTDNSTEARLIAGTGFKLFVGPTATNDEFYFGMQKPFYRLYLAFTTVGVQNSAVTLEWAYYNGSAFTAFTPSADGTSGLTADGAITWTSGLTGSWATTSVNSKSLYWIRLRFTAGSWTTNPLVGHATVGGWVRYFSGTNQAVYRQGGGNQFYLEVNDAGTGSATDARLRGWETMATWTSYGVNTGTGPFPTVLQATNGVFARKSAAANGTTRTWYLAGDDRTFHLFVFTTDVSNTTFNFSFGDFYSFVPSDGYRTGIWGRNAESSSGTNTDSAWSMSAGPDAMATLTLAGQWLARNYGSSVAGSVAMSKHTDNAKVTNNGGCVGTAAYPNGADGNILVERFFIHEATEQLRGYVRGAVCFLHPVANINDADTLNGASSGAFTGRTYTAIKSVNSNVGQAGVILIQTSDDWDTN